MAVSGAINPEKTGLMYWMDQVLEEHAKLGDHLSADPVHDLRVALRRCILIADIMKDLDPGGDWKPMRKAGRHLFQHLGALRDAQVLTEWVERLGTPGEASTATLLEGLKAKYEQDRATAQDAAREFDRKQWRAWVRELTGRFRHLVSDQSACEALALETWEAVRDLHRRAQKNRSRIAYHRLRVELKKFRYAVENFLPSMYPGWAPDLKFLQDLLGEIHDLDVLSQMIVKNRRRSDEATRTLWAKKLEAERSSRLQQYRAKMAGKSSPLWVWREGLPGERKLRSAGLARLAAWAYFVTPDFPRVRKVARFALQIYDGFANCGLVGRDSDIEERFILHAAALLQDVGLFRKSKAHHKESYRMIRRTTPPVGWSKRDLDLVALVARFHRRALPDLHHKILKTYQLPLRQSLVLLAAMLRLANAFGAKPYRGVRRLEVENCSGVIVVRAEGYIEAQPLASKLSVAIRLMEFACHHPVHILAPGARIMAPRLVRQAAHSDAA
ncbi:MAG: CHAD domain-containing protein [Acidobacteriia bacterium]|nr:CHAD domain-containing protein [Terriglobia bacterium]